MGRGYNYNMEVVCMELFDIIVTSVFAGTVVAIPVSRIVILIKERRK